MSEITVKRCVRTGRVPSRLGPMVLHRRTKMRYHTFGQQLQLEAEGNSCIIISMHLHHHLRNIYLTRSIPKRLALQNVHRIRINEGRLHTVRLTERRELISEDSNNLGTQALHWQTQGQTCASAAYPRFKLDPSHDARLYTRLPVSA